jgi:hypothetical protein
MASSDFDAVNALRRRGDEYEKRSGFAHGADKYAEAIALACHLPGLPEDSLVVAHLQLARCSALLSQSKQAPVSDADSEAQWTAAFRELLLTQASLARRADARTLLPGACHAREEAWFETQAPPELPQLARPPLQAEWRQLVGYDALCCGAYATLHAARVLGAQNTQSIALLLTSPQAFDFVTRALDAMLLPRPVSNMPMACEMAVVGVMEQFLNEPRSTIMPRIGAVREAWARLQRSGVLEVRSLAGLSSAAFQCITRTTEARASAAVARAAQRGLRTCALPSCGAREAHVAHFKLCGRCSGAAYCSREHQDCALAGAQGGVQAGGGGGGGGGGWRWCSLTQRVADFLG